jgi:hypothetical protein
MAAFSVVVVAIAAARLAIFGLICGTPRRCAWPLCLGVPGAASQLAYAARQRVSRMCLRRGD